MIGVEPGRRRRCAPPPGQTARCDHAAAAGVTAEDATQALDPRSLRRRGVIEVRRRRYADAREGSPRGVAGGGYGGISHAEDGLVREHAEDASGGGGGGGCRRAARERARGGRCFGRGGSVPRFVSPRLRPGHCRFVVVVARCASPDRFDGEVEGPPRFRVAIHVQTEMNRPEVNARSGKKRGDENRITKIIIGSIFCSHEGSAGRGGGGGGDA